MPKPFSPENFPLKLLRRALPYLGLAMGPALPAGAHTVVFLYFSAVCWVGGALSAAVVVLAGGQLFSRRRLPGPGTA